MGKEKSVLIPMELFANLVKHHLLEIDGLEGKIRSGLEAKMNRFEEHQLYSTYKMSPDPEEKEKARQDYLDKKGIHKDFRW